MSNLQFGLTLSSKAQASKKPLLKPSPGIFQTDDDDDAEGDAATRSRGDVRKSMSSAIMQGAAKKVSCSWGPSWPIVKKFTESTRYSQADIALQKALAEDPTVFQYDEVFDKVQTQKKAQDIFAKKKEDTGPKYVHALMEKAEERKRDRERVELNKIKRDREKEGEEFGDKEEFVTEKYVGVILEPLLSRALVG